MPSFGGGSIIFTFRHLVFIILQLIDNYSVEIIEKGAFYLLVCKESFELEAETVLLKFTTWIRFS